MMILIKLWNFLKLLSGWGRADMWQWLWPYNNRLSFKWKIVAAFRGMHVSPAKHSFGKCDRKVWQTDRQTDRRTNRRTTNKVIPMCSYALQATQKHILVQYLVGHYYPDLNRMDQRVFRRQRSSGGNQIWIRNINECVWKVRFKFLSTDDDNNNDDDIRAMAIHVILRKLMFRQTQKWWWVWGISIQ